MIRAYLFTRIISVKNYICVRFNSSSRDGLYFYYNMLLLNRVLFFLILLSIDQCGAIYNITVYTL